MTTQSELDLYRTEYQRYRAEFTLSRPPPRLRLQSPLGEWRFWIFGTVALFAPLVSGFRTFAAFQHVAAIAPLVEGLLGVVAVEFGLIGYQIERIQRKARAKQLKTLGERWLLVGVGITLFIAMVANVDLVLDRASQPIPQPYRGWLIGIVVGGLLPVLGLIAGEVLGRLFYELDAANQTARRRHLRDVERWEEKLAASWSRVKSRRLRQVAGSDSGKLDLSVSPSGSLPVALPERPAWLTAVPADLPEFRQLVAEGRIRLPETVTGAELAQHIPAVANDRTGRNWLASVRVVGSDNGR